MIVIPMAGLSSRFTKAGYRVPKYMLDLHGRPVFDYALASFRAQFEQAPFMIICRDVQGTPDFVRARCAVLGIKDVELAVLTTPTSGQGETVLLGLDAAGVPDTEPATIFNIDSFRAGFHFPDDRPDGVSFLEVFRGAGDHWSFVEPAPDDATQGAGSARRVIEKIRISDLCCTGLYHFRSAGDYRHAYAKERAAPSQDLSETYIAPMYNQLIARGDTVRFKVIDLAALDFCGVPTEYETCRANPGLVSKLFADRRP